MCNIKLNYWYDFFGLMAKHVDLPVRRVQASGEGELIGEECMFH